MQKVEKSCYRIQKTSFVNFIKHIKLRFEIANVNFCPKHVDHTGTKGIFGNYFFPLFFVFKNNFLFLKLKNLFGNSKSIKKQKLLSKLNCEEN